MTEMLRNLEKNKEMLVNQLIDISLKIDHIDHDEIQTTKTFWMTEGQKELYYDEIQYNKFLRDKIDYLKSYEYLKCVECKNKYWFASDEPKCCYECIFIHHESVGLSCYCEYCM